MHLLLAETAVDGFKNLINAISQPAPFLGISTVALLVFLAGYRKLTHAGLALAVLIGFTLFYALSAFDSDFRSIIAKPDNVPISIMIYLVGFFFWLAFWQAARNDRRRQAGQPLFETGAEDKVLVWPDLVYIELIALVLCTVLLVVWTVMLPAPLEQPADPSVAPNPAKAPWYFLGLQELLVYFDPWIAGVLLPGFIILGLAAIPYLDKNPRGNGYYTFRERPFAITTFMVGFGLLWVVLIVFGTFLRGPNWNFFGPYEYWDAHRPVALVNVEFRDLFWVKLLGRGIPTEDLGPIPAYLIREAPGIAVLLAYFVLGPVILYKVFFAKMYAQLGLLRFVLMSHLLLWMLLVPIKMVLRWTLNLHYIVAITELFFNV
ncbi:MAG: hypothetical protein ACYSUQ_04760 [Planctomycetota bacterium]|jgi:hypothetical protein